MIIISVTPPARNYFRFDQEADPTDNNEHESWKVNLKIFCNSDNKIDNNLYQELGLFSLKMNLKATSSIGTWWEHYQVSISDESSNLTWREKDLGEWSWQGVYLDKMLETPLSLLVVDEERLTSNCLICVIIWEIIILLMWKREWRQALLISTLLLKPTITNIFLYQLTAANLKLTSMFIQRIVVKIHLREMFI